MATHLKTIQEKKTKEKVDTKTQEAAGELAYLIRASHRQWLELCRTCHTLFL